MEPKYKLAAEMLRDALYALYGCAAHPMPLKYTLIDAGMPGELAENLAFSPETAPLWVFIAAADLRGAKLLLALPDSADAKAITAALGGLRGTAPDGAN